MPKHLGQHATFIIVVVLTTGKVVDQFWHEIADYLNEIETLYEELLTSLPFFCHECFLQTQAVGPWTPFFVVKDPGFSGREMAALVASKVFYHLEEYDDALRLALGAGLRLWHLPDLKLR